MRIGGQTVRIEIHQNVKIGVTALNEDQNEDVVWKTVWAEMVMRQGRESVEQDTKFAMTSFFFTCRFLSVKGIDPSMWIVFKGQAYDIRNIDPDFAAQDSVTIEARVRNVVVA